MLPQTWPVKPVKMTWPLE